MKDLTENTSRVIICRCGANIPEHNIDHYNGCNEEGEEYGVVSAYCDICHKEYETSQWGEWDDYIQAKNTLIQYIKNSD
jgi:hypothetical protein